MEYSKTQIEFIKLSKLLRRFIYEFTQLRFVSAEMQEACEAGCIAYTRYSSVRDQLHIILRKKQEYDKIPNDKGITYEQYYDYVGAIEDLARELIEEWVEDNLPD